MKRIFAAILGLVVLAVYSQGQQFLGADNQEYTNVVLTTTNMVGMTQLLPEAKNDPDHRTAVLVAQESFCSDSNSTATAMIVYGTNSVVGGGQQIMPGGCTAINSPPHPQHAVYGYLTAPGTNTIRIVRQPAAYQ